MRKYSSTIKSRSFLFIELKNLCKCYLDGVDYSELKLKIINENLFQTESENRRRELAPTVLKRLQALDSFLVNKIVSRDTGTGKVIAVFAIEKTDRLFHDFVTEVIADKFSVLDTYLTDRDFEHFFESKGQQSEIVRAWKPYTLYKLKQVFIRILYEAGFLKSNSSNRELNRPLIDPEVRNYLLKIDSLSIGRCLA
ncbi:DUF1819 family protein [Sporolactobacillus nakayamae]|uniref:Putative inner membrane protein n=1 Tax=Sporolactobacillus nakayamae TaxID=269670 RepID=A0A1I2QSC3_9BACL|nr:DUF1819 family protein [Sporolactobacillus nakayamae]SFG31322.1 Putative inner membrane protein [Sporolactobacillus nakayamae]